MLNITLLLHEDLIRFITAQVGRRVMGRTLEPTLATKCALDVSYLVCRQKLPGWLQYCFCLTSNFGECSFYHAPDISRLWLIVPTVTSFAQQHTNARRKRKKTHSDSLIFLLFFYILFCWVFFRYSWPTNVLNGGRHDLFFSRAETIH